MINQKNNSGFSLLTTFVVVLGIITIGLAVFGLSQESGAKKLFTNPVESSTPTSASASNTTTNSLDSDDQARASANISSIDFNLEAYFSAFSYFPASINPDEFAALANSGNYSGSSPVSSMQTATTEPTGVTYAYAATPAGCTTAAKDCMHFTLEAKDKAGNLIGQKQVSLE